jgi:hypothetical protein
MKSMYFFASVIIVFITLGCLLPSGKNGSYNKLTKQITCNSKENCLHEATHKYDHQNHWISKTDEWINAVDNYRMIQFMLLPSQRDNDAWVVEFFPGIGRERLPEINPFTDSFWNGGWGGYSELYAWLAEESDGDINNIPEPLREFYDMEDINNTMKGLGY